MRYGIPLAVNRSLWVAVAEEADRLGFDTAWVPEHLVLPVEMAGSPYGGDHPPIPPETPTYDAIVQLAHLAGRTERLRLGTNVYNIGLRHPFVVARAVLTLDLVSNGRATFGVGASWLRQEWDAVGLDFDQRGARVDEAIEVCRRLWTDAVVEHHGASFDFDPVAFEPKPVQQPHPPVLVGGESAAALKRAARLGDGWIALDPDPEQVAVRVRRLEQLRDEHGRADAPFVVVCPSTGEADHVRRLEEAGVDEVIVRPWRRSGEALEGLRRFADDHGLETVS